MVKNKEQLTRVICMIVLVMVGAIIGGCAVRKLSPPPLVRTREMPPAAASLLAEAETALEKGDAARAETYLERAIRIDPEGPVLWSALAQVKYKREQYPQAIQMALKSNANAAGDSGLRRKNWFLMEEAYLQMGDGRKAREARDNAMKEDGG